MDKLVGAVTHDEKEEILDLFEKRLAYENLLQILDPTDEERFQNLMNKYQSVISTYDRWWSQKSEQYNWESAENGSWFIDFSSGDIFLRSES